MSVLGEVTVTEKYCPSCGRVLPRRCFHRNRLLKSGLQSSCIECQRARKGTKPKPFRGPNGHGDWRCCDCGEWKPLDAFPPPRSATPPHRVCRACRRAYQREWFAAARHNPQVRAIRKAIHERLSAARKAQRAKDRAWRREFVRSTLTDLLAAGWPEAELRRRLQVRPRDVRRWLADDGDRKVSDVTVEKVRRLREALRDEEAKAA